MDETPNLALALAELRGAVELGFERTNSSTALILLRLDQLDDKHAELAKHVEQLQTRLAEVEKTAVTTTQLTERTRQIIAIVGVLVTLAGAVVALIQLTRG
ncbi:hypothetical protein [Nonomuraea basaltis]|uniref:hypothetical protein n=1 Tax=Nonomuraea basaltis TaxID=2495887 RepID=UPI00110C44F5|nr:hypothetical protein [Nonomuraea basaltis]TMR91454.1 hypothetical protein EJK15_49800 [Nonomuraea basaltis]